MPSGKIKYFNKEKGYGFITQDSGGRDVFIHISHIRIHQIEIVEGQRVEYEIAIGPKGPEAREVVVFPEIEPKSEIIDRGRKMMPPKRKKFPAKKPRPKPPTSEIKQKEKPPKEPTPSQPKLPKPPVIFPGEVYLRHRVEDKETMVLALYSHELLACKLHNINVYDLEVMVDDVDDQIRKIIKTDIKYCYKRSDEELVKAGIQIDEQLKAQGLRPIVRIKERFEVRGRLLRRYAQAQIPVTFIMREGEIISGLIEWKDHYNCKVKLSTGASILLFRHALYGFSAPDLPLPFRAEEFEQRFDGL